MKEKTLKVRGGKTHEGKPIQMPLPRQVTIDGRVVSLVIGARPQVFTPETVVEVRDCAFVRRAISSGDMVRAEVKGA